MEGACTESSTEAPSAPAAPVADGAPTRADQEIGSANKRLQVPAYHAYPGAEPPLASEEQDRYNEASKSLIDYCRRHVEEEDYVLVPGWTRWVRSFLPSRAALAKRARITASCVMGSLNVYTFTALRRTVRGALLSVQSPVILGWSLRPSRVMQVSYKPNTGAAVVKASAAWVATSVVTAAMISLYYRRCNFRSLEDIFSPTGKEGALIESKREMRAFRTRVSALADSLIRSRTLYHNGCLQSHMNLPSQNPAPGAVKVAAKTRFERAAMNYKPPTEAEVTAKLPKTPTSSTHPRLAAARFLNVTKLRNIPKDLKIKQHDPFISSNGRDDGAYGDRPIHQLKDLGNAPVACDPEEVNSPRRIVTLIDSLCYAHSLREYSGDDIIAWAPYYPDLAGKTDESVYYADSENTFTEIIGLTQVVGSWKGQLAWDFTCNDVVYIENMDGSAFTVYKVYRYPHPELLKQTVFFCAIQTVNLPYSVVDLLTQWTKDHSLGSSGIGTPGPAKNVTLVPRDPLRPHTKDILVMSCGTPEFPTVAVKYKDDTGPYSSARMTEAVYNWIKYQHTCGGRGLTVHEAIKRLEMFAREGEETNVPGSAAYCELLRTVSWWGDLPCVVYYDYRESDTHLPSVPVEEESAKAVLAAPNISKEKPCVLAKNPEAMKAYKREKMEGMANDVVPTSDWTKIASLVVKQFVLGTSAQSGVKKQSLHLIDGEKVLESRTRKAQVARAVTDGIGPAPPELGRVENKTEAAHKTAACPRGVQNPEYDVSINSGRLAKSFAPVLDELDFYDPGRSPVPIAEHMRRTYEMSIKHQTKFEGGGIRSVDYTGADEKHCKLSNLILREMIIFYFVESDVEEALAIYDSCFHMRLKVGSSVKSSGWKNASGTGITTLLNTIVFAAREMQTVIVAMVFRSMEDAGELKRGEYIQDKYGNDFITKPYPDLNYPKFLKHLRIIDSTWELHKIAGANCPKVPVLQTIFTWIGPKFGDDGVDPSTPYVSNWLYECAMKYVDRQDGFVRKLETTNAAKEQPVEYLSRIYPCPLRTLSSFCKVEKALAKLSVAVGRDRDRYILKLKGYFENDRNTPIVGAFLEAVSNMYGVTLSKMTEEEMVSLADDDKELYWKLANGPFPSDDGASDEAYACVGADYGVSSGELREFDDKLRSQHTWAGIQEMMVPAKIMDETQEDPLGLTGKKDPPGVERVAAFDCTTKGADPRMEDFESVGATSANPTSLEANSPELAERLRTARERSSAARAAFGME